MGWGRFRTKWLYAFMCVLLERGDLSFIGTQEEAKELRWKRK
jgi:hypothetical protein